MHLLTTLKKAAANRKNKGGHTMQNKLVVQVAQILGKSYNEVAHNMAQVDIIAELVKEVDKRETMLKLFIVEDVE
jgi:hypothetical protein